MAYSTLLVRFVLLYTALCSLVDAQLIPRRPPGVTLGNGSVTLVSNSSPIGRVHAIYFSNKASINFSHIQVAAKIKSLAQKTFLWDHKYNGCLVKTHV
ncbi:hypothetical protein KXD40_004133 [Peronospora effusa]|nr:hypothetical protein KXD40_004133 [Peronospora effusa]